jgi:hypothetical protein
MSLFTATAAPAVTDPLTAGPQAALSEATSKCDEFRISELIHYCLVRGIIYGLKPSATLESAGISYSAHSVHTPITAAPYAYPKQAFDKAQHLMPLFNTLYAR